MNNKFYVFAVLLVALMLLGVGYAYSGEGTAETEENPKEEGAVVVLDGEGSAAAEPELVELSFSVITETRDPEQGQKENSERINEVMQALITMGVDEEDITMGTYQLRPLRAHEIDEEKRQEYVITNELDVVLTDLDKLGEAINTGIQAGANRVGAINFGVSSKEEYKQEALALALQQTRDKVEGIAEFYGKETVELKRVEEQSTVFRGFEMDMAEDVAMEYELEDPVPADPDDIGVNARVKVEYTIK